ncbi:MAG TPA: hypothetical protein VG713_20730 [Pirellulales bacterium]|nr:hypothetical protein [Pirellulales bacterium]
MNALYSWVGFVAITAAALAARGADEATNVVPAAEARSHVGEKCTVEMTVEGGRKLAAKGPCILNSMRNFRDKDNFSVIMFAEALDKYKEVGVQDPSEHLYGKKIQVTGKIELYKEQPQIKVTDPDEIKLVEETKD